MFQRTKERLFPLLWGWDLTDKENDLQRQHSALRDRLVRGMLLWDKLLTSGFWRFSAKRQIKKQLDILRTEYRDLLSELVRAERPIAPPSPWIETGGKRFWLNRTTGEYEIENPRMTAPYVPTPRPERFARRTPDEPTPVGMVFESFDTNPPPAPIAYSGHGGGFGGAGASGSWDPPSSSDSSASSCDSSSSDSGSSDSGSCDSGSSND